MFHGRSPGNECLVVSMQVLDVPWCFFLLAMDVPWSFRLWWMFHDFSADVGSSMMSMVMTIVHCCFCWWWKFDGVSFCLGCPMMFLLVMDVPWCFWWSWVRWVCCGLSTSDRCSSWRSAFTCVIHSEFLKLWGKEDHPLKIKASWNWAYPFFFFFTLICLLQYKKLLWWFSHIRCPDILSLFSALYYVCISLCCLHQAEFQNTPAIMHFSTGLRSLTVSTPPIRGHLVKCAAEDKTPCTTTCWLSYPCMILFMKIDSIITVTFSIDEFIYMYMSMLVGSSV